MRGRGAQDIIDELGCPELKVSFGAAPLMLDTLH